MGKLLKKKVIVQTIAEKGYFFSSVFLWIKKWGIYKIILNLKKLNKYTDVKHFKMELLQNVLHMVKPEPWKASVNRQDAYYSVPFHEEYQKYLKIF